MKRSKTDRLIPVAIVASALVLAYPLEAQPVTEDWVDTHAGFYSVGVVTTEDGFAYVTGRSDLTADNGFRSDIVTIKYDLAGNRVWERVFDETDDATNGTDLPAWLALDPFGNLIVTGVSFINTTGDDILTLKYDSDGNLLWKVRSTSGLAVSRVATDAAGNIYVAGVTSTVPSGSDFITIKYDPAGNELWTRIDPGGFGDSVSGLEVTQSGEAVVVGESSNGVSCFDVTTIFYEPDGTRRWLRTYTSAVTCGLDSGSDVDFGPDGEIYVGGYTDNGSDVDFVLIRYDQDGNEIWVRTLDEGNSQLASRLRVDSLGNPVLIGVSNSDFTALKYDPSGNLLWTAHVDILSEDIPFNMAIGPDDAVYLTGYATIGSLSVATVKLDADGNLQWTATWDAAVHSDIGWGVALDPTGNVLVSGQGQSNMITIRYLQEDPASALTVTATPIGAPIEIPAQGGTLRYDVEVVNIGATAKTFDLWVTMSGNGVDRTVGPFSRTLGPGASLNRRFRQAVPAGAPAGAYTQTVSVGVFPTAEASDGFSWDKLP